jgi:cytochrome P450
VDRSTGSPEETEALYEFVKKFSEGATLVHSTRDHDEVRAEVAEALERFDEQFLEPSIRRRRQLLDEVAAGGRDPAELPNDVLTTLLRNQDHLDLPHDVIRREIAFYLQAGSHSTANAFTHTVDELFCWAEEHPEDLEAARTDRRFLQRCVHETLRLHPASPVSWRKAVEPVILSDGTELPVGELVVLDLETANRDPRLFGDYADRFDPHRQLAEGIPPWGHSFGGGVHACIGMELDGGLEPDPDLPPDEHLFGTVAVMVDAFLAAGGRPDPQQPPVLDPTSVRTHFSSYPVVFDGLRR